MPEEHGPINGQQFQVKMQSKETDNLLGVKELPSKMMSVTVFRLCDDNIIRSFQDDMSVGDYKCYVEKIKACECGDFEEIFDVLQEYGIVPESMVLDRFMQVINEKMDRFSFLNNIINRFRDKSSTDDYLECWFTPVQIFLEPIVTNIFIPPIFIKACTESGVSVTACGEAIDCPPGCLFCITCFIYIGIWDISPWIDLDGASSIGFCIYCIVECIC